MRCPYCRSENTEVIDSRDTVNGESIRRRRECTSCGKRFTTYERVDLAEITVIKKDSTRQPFDRVKILNGIVHACEKRPVSMEQAEAIVDKVESKIRASGIHEIESRKIGDMVVKELFRLDPVAYIRFASVYNNFDSPEEFKKAVLQFKNAGRPKGRARRPAR
jgi:transcriptional repressor NrdR